MIPALNDLRRDAGLPTVPTLTGRRRASRVLCGKFAGTLRGVCREVALAQRGRDTMRANADLNAGSDDIASPDWREQGRRVRMDAAVLAGFAFTGGLLARVAAQVREE
jgi:hypothetical protein